MGTILDFVLSGKSALGRPPVKGFGDYGLKIMTKNKFCPGEPLSYETPITVGKLDATLGPYCKEFRYKEEESVLDEDTGTITVRKKRLPVKFKIVVIHQEPFGKFRDDQEWLVSRKSDDTISIDAI